MYCKTLHTRSICMTLDMQCNISGFDSNSHSWLNIGMPAIARNTICCCECQQTIRIKGSQAQGDPLDNAQVGDIVTQSVTSSPPYIASGVIIAIERLGGDLDRIIVKVDDCANLFVSGDGDIEHIKINGTVVQDFQGVVVTTDTCGKVR